jgi:hypothetical protein
LKLRGLKCLYSRETNQVILFWSEVDNTSWIRVFIDRIYCGVDSYEEDFSQQGADSDDDLLINHDTMINGLTIISAFVESEDTNESPFITLKINLTQNRQLILDYREGENDITLTQSFISPISKMIHHIENLSNPLVTNYIT